MICFVLEDRRGVSRKGNISTVLERWVGIPKTEKGGRACEVEGTAHTKAQGLKAL